MTKEKIIVWCKYAGVRALKTFAQCFAGFITVGATLGEVDWRYALSCSAVALLYSVVTSVAGLPETKESAK